MFFTDDVLQVRNGRFGIIWLAAMKRDLLKKRQYENENVEETCHELRRHFKPTFTGGMMKIAGFSLRLSAQLAYGVTVVYSLQVSNLYKEVTLAFQDLTRYRSRLMMQSIDLDSKKQKLTDNQISVPENYLQNDPTFGELYAPPCDEFAPMPQAARSEARQRNVVVDISTITLPEEIPTRPIDHVSLFEGSQGTSFDKPDPDFINFGATDQDGGLGFMEIPEVTNIETPLTSKLPSVIKDVPKTPSKEKRRQKQSDFDSPLAVPVVEVDTLDEEILQQTSIDAESVNRETNRIEQNERVGLSETSELILAPLQDPSIQSRKKKKLQLIDKYIELSSDEMRNQLRSTYMSIEDYKAEGHLDEPVHIASAKELFENDGHMFSGSYLNHIDEYAHKKKGRFERLHKTCLPTRTFNQQIQVIEKIEPKSKTRKTFSAYKEAQQEKVQHQPEDEYREMLDGPKFDETIPTDITVDGSFELERNLSRISGRMVDTTVGSHSTILEREHTKDFVLEDEFLGQTMVEQDIGHAETESSQAKQHKPTISYIDDMLASSEDGIMFSSLAPPGVVTKQFAAQCFYDVLTMGKRELIRMSQQSPYEDFVIFRV